MNPPFRLLVTGSRAVSNAQARYVQDVLDDLVAEIRRGDPIRQIIIVQGECPYGGVDKVAEWYARVTSGCRNEGHPARWKALGSSAGPARNAEMVAAGADLCVAFPDTGSRGTWDCIRKAADAGIEVRVRSIAPIGGR